MGWAFVVLVEALLILRELLKDKKQKR